jgi:hypothetical protein
MSRITDLFEDTIDEYSWRAGYDQAVIEDTKKVELALHIVSYLVKENRELRRKLALSEGDDLVECGVCGEEFLWWQENAHFVKKCGDY